MPMPLGPSRSAMSVAAGVLTDGYRSFRFDYPLPPAVEVQCFPVMSRRA
jgi:hypothetical protein